ncbi:hypothetical protein Goshw_008065 [Gossypium schwendimanii]|uniref:Aminotransferase-like plant mobile domain-containing protein n=1 Tax=Gossypium schwendimanii TaxID=34291 RepID=A0A7J9LUP9_GOSSC|nr:hypothetical protein [Gossypium schwendimanii]
MAHEMLDDEHKIDLQRPNTHWSLFHSEYIEIWENQYYNIPTCEPVMVPELACNLDYMSWFRIYGKPYLLSEEERRWQIRVERKQQGPLNPRIMGDETGPSTAPKQSPALTEQATIPTPQPLQIMPNAYPNSYVYPNPYMYPFSTPMSGGTTRGTVGELNSFSIPIVLWDSSRLRSFAVGDANTSEIFALSM